MKAKTLTQALLLSGVATCFCSSQGWAVTAIEYAKGASGGAHCQQVGGGVLTNFLDSTHTEGTSTGDIRGAVGVEIFGVNGNVYHVQHHWVTDSGDTIYVKDAFLTLFPTSDPNRVLGDYLDGADIIGGTGRFNNATGKIFAFGAADLSLGQITLRYAGTVCFQPAGG
jgi:hypothetical protein